MQKLKILKIAVCLLLSLTIAATGTPVAVSADAGTEVSSLSVSADSSPETLSSDTSSSGSAADTSSAGTLSSSVSSSATSSSAVTSADDSSDISSAASAADASSVTEAPLTGAAESSLNGADAGISSGLYVIQSRLSENAVLDVASGSLADRANVQLYQNNGTRAQLFYLHALGGGLYSFENYNSGKMLDVSGASNRDGANVQQYASNGSAAQKWYIRVMADGYVTIQSLLGDRVLDAAGGSSVNGTNIQIYSANSSYAQQWKLSSPIPGSYLAAAAAFQPADIAEGWYVIHPEKNQDMAVDVTGASKEDGANIQLYSANGTNAQFFKITPLGNQQYSITSYLSGKMIDVSGGAFSNGSNIQQYTSNNTAAQKWYIEENSSSGDYVIESAGLRKMVMELSGGQTAGGTNIDLYEFNNGEGQYFTLEKADEAALHRLADGVYTVGNADNNQKVLDIASAGTENGTNVQLYDANGTNAQKFSVKCIDRKNYYYSIINMNSGKSLDVKAGSPTAGTNVQQYASNGSDAQIWQIKYAGGAYTILSACGWLSLDIQNGSMSNGANIEIWTPNGSSAQRWAFTPTQALPPDPGMYILESAGNPAMALDIAAGSWDDQANVQLYSSNGTNAQKFNLVKNSDGTYTFISLVSGKVLDIANGGSTAGTNVQQYSSNNSAAQKWKITSAGEPNLSYYITAAGSGLALDVYSGSFSNGANIDIYTKNATAAQKFIFVKTSASPTGWRSDTSGNHYYYVNGVIQTGWQNISGNYYYFNSSGVMQKSCIIDNYYIGSDGVRASSIVPYLNTVNGTRTLTALLQNALVPCGRTLYIWGGGWGGMGTDTESDSSKIGYLSSWGSFFKAHAQAGYDYTQYRYAYGNGLDCSGYLAWVVYNTLYTKDNLTNMVMYSGDIAPTYISKGWAYQDSSVYRPGDVVSMSGHVWLCLGTCSDGTVMLIHSSPKGCQISGTSGKAAELADKYMKKYFSYWPYSAKTISSSYFDYTGKATWYTNGRGVLTDPDGLQFKSAEDLMKFLLGSV